VRRSAHQWAELIEAQATSGLSIAAFCRERRLGANSFYQWRRKLERSARARPAPRPFVRLRRSDGGGVSAGDSSESGVWNGEAVVVRFIDGVELHVSGERLGEVLALLRAGGSAGVLG